MSELGQQRTLGQKSHGRLHHGLIPLPPRLACSDLQTLLAATLDGMGIALLPESYARQGLSTGRLHHVWPVWRAPDSIVHMVFPSRRGMAPATRAFVEHVAKQLPPRFA